jgi:XTP/dITP diphosphohydrolase
LQKENRNPEAKFSLKGRVIFLATNNIHKFNESRLVLSKHKIAVGMLRAKTTEIQSDNLRDIAETSAIAAFRKCHLPLIVEDAGLFIEALRGFPGPYAAYAYKTLGNPGVLKLMENVPNRKAKFKSAIAYQDDRLKAPTCFEGEAEGEITTEEHKGNGQSGFGFDPIFRPLRKAKTFAEMTTEEKNSFSHRAKAINKFAEWYEKQKQPENAV